ncbi:MAG: putative F0F1-ATPase [Pelotomaculum sp. PtaB.Bin104]|nr:MAG: putative F0F1-ATPase [Pelotomaculum sp. PtaB.Bin104]
MAEKKDREQEPNKQSQGLALQALSLATAIGTELAVTVVSGYYCGQFLDRRFATEPWLMLAGVVAGIAVGIAGICKTLQVFLVERK